MGKTYLHKALAKAKQPKWKNIPLRLMLWANRYNYDVAEDRNERNQLRDRIAKKELEQMKKEIQ